MLNILSLSLLLKKLSTFPFRIKPKRKEKKEPQVIDTTQVINSFHSWQLKKTQIPDLQSV